jgi:hypothetical protein
VAGRWIVIATWATLGLFALVAIPNAVGLHVLWWPVTAVSLTLFLASLPVWIYAFGLAIVRSTRGDDIVVSSWVFLTGSAPKDVRTQFMRAIAVSVVLGIGTVWANPFGVLVPMLTLGLSALWGARHGVFPPRATAKPVRANRGGRA